MLIAIVTYVFGTISLLPTITNGLPYHIVFPSPCSQNQCIMENTGQPGVCKPFDTCVNVQYNWLNQGIHPTTCSFDQFNPIICCPLDNQHLININSPRPLIKNKPPGRAPAPPLMTTKSTPVVRQPPISTTTISTIRQNIVQQQRKSVKICEDTYVIPKAEEGEFHITVVGGELAEKGEFPYMAAIGWNNFLNETEFNCGGFLVSSNFILTAAHCTKLGGASPDTVRIGDDGLNSTSDTDYDYGDTTASQDFNIERIYVHPNYNAKETYNDIALIKFFGSSSVRPACLWQSDDIIGQYSEAEAIGYGHTQFAGARSNFLMKVTLGIIINIECSIHYKPEEKFPRGIITTQMCAGDPTGVKDTCQGDSGGPIIVKNVDKTPYVIGITSFGSGCALGVPSVYTRISSYLDWIESIVWP